MSVVPVARLQALAKLRCSIFETSYNPTNARTGLKYLRAALRGPAMMQYYPPRPPRLASLKAMFPDSPLIDLGENQRLDDIEARRRRGKGAPKKGQGRRSTMKKK